MDKNSQSRDPTLCDRHFKTEPVLVIWKEFYRLTSSGIEAIKQEALHLYSLLLDFAPKPWKYDWFKTQLGGGGEGGGSTQQDARVWRCEGGAQTMTLFKNQISDFPTLFKVIAPK